jgi:hypothetical protein
MGIKVQRVQIKGFKAIQDLDVDLEGKSIYLIADNQRGKSSFMDAIQIALGDKKSIPENMSGEAKVETTIDGKPYTFAFKTKKGNVELEVTLPDGIKETKKGIIGGIVGAIGFDVNEFVKKSESKTGRKEQVEQYKKMLPQDFIEGIEKFEKQAKMLYDDRTELGRKVDTLKGFIRESPLFGNDLKIQPVDVSALNTDLEKANAHNAKINGAKQRVEDRKLSISAKESKIEALKAELAELERVLATEKQQQKDAGTWLEKNLPIDTSTLLTALNNASETNVKAEKAKEHKVKLEQLEKLEEQYNDLTVQIEVNKQAISDAIKDFQSPVEGLSFDDEQLLYNGTPVTLQNLSTSQIIELGIQMQNAFNPNLGLMFIENSNVIGKQRMNDIFEYAKKYDLQLFFEEVQRGQDELKIEFVKELE